MEISEILKSIRKIKGLTQGVVCKKLKISQTHLSQMEAGKKSPSPEMFQKLCKLYGIPRQIVYWKSITEKDIPKEKKELFKQLSPVINSLVDEFFKLTSAPAEK